MCDGVRNIGKDYPSITARSDKTASKFALAFEHFGECHRGYNSSVCMKEKDIDALGKFKYTMPVILKLIYINISAETNIRTFLKFYRENFPKASILPKMHILEDHVIPWMRRWKVGAGLMGEQGAESIHAHMMKLERVYQSMPNELDRLKYIFQEQTLESAPSLTNLRPPPKKKRKTSTKKNETSTDIL